MEVSPSEKKLYARLDSCKEYGNYSERVENGFTYMGMGVAGPIFLMQTYDFNLRPGNWKKNLKILRQGYRICGTLGVNMRIVDDLMDGDNMTQVNDREKLWDNYLQSLKTGNMPEPDETQDEKIAYRAGQIMHEYFNQAVIEELEEHLDKLRKLLKEEDKSTEEGYRRYAKGFGGEYGMMLVTAMKNIDSYEPSEKDYSFARDYGLSTQIADDRFDDDIGLDYETRDKLYNEFLNDLLNHSGFIPQLIGKSGLRMPKIYNFLMFSAGKIEKLKR